MTNIVLVQGMWGDGSGWSGVIPRLQDEGHTVVAVQNPLESLAGDIEHTRDVLDRLDGPIVMAGHSYGGAVISGAAVDRPDVVALAFVAAWALDEGETIGGLFEQSRPLESGTHVQPDEHGRVWLDPAHFHEDFCQDVGDVDARVMAAVQNPPAGSILGEPLPGEPAWRTLPSWYQVSEQDHMIPPELEERFAARMGARTLSLDAGHASMVSRPREIAAMVMEAARTA
jgi:pimeloyl-ACP methyl ester carboxylesterase